jgi:hypothetical protein
MMINYNTEFLDLYEELSDTWDLKEATLNESSGYLGKLLSAAKPTHKDHEWLFKFDSDLFLQCFPNDSVLRDWATRGYFDNYYKKIEELFYSNHPDPEKGSRLPKASVGNIVEAPSKSNLQAHHIVLRCMSGPDEVYNLIAVTKEDHLELHKSFHFCLEECLKDSLESDDLRLLTELTNYLHKAKASVDVIGYFNNIPASVKTLSPTEISDIISEAHLLLANASYAAEDSLNSEIRAKLLQALQQKQHYREKQFSRTTMKPASIANLSNPKDIYEFSLLVDEPDAAGNRPVYTAEGKAGIMEVVKKRFDELGLEGLPGTQTKFLAWPKSDNNVNGFLARHGTKLFSMLKSVSGTRAGKQHVHSGPYIAFRYDAKQDKNGNYNYVHDYSFGLYDTNANRLRTRVDLYWGKGKITDPAGSWTGGARVLATENSTHLRNGDTVLTAGTTGTLKVDSQFRVYACIIFAKDLKRLMQLTNKPVELLDAKGNTITVDVDTTDPTFTE